MTESIESYWKQKGDIFDQYYTRSKNPLQNLVVDFLEARQRYLLDAICRQVHPGDHVLDVGCGSGLHLQMLLSMGAVVTGVDYSAAMLKLAHPRLAMLGAQSVLIMGDAQRLMFPDAAFDAAIMVGLLDYVPDPEGIVAELLRVVKPGGHVIITVPKNPSPFFFIRRGIGGWLRGKLFDLPPIVTALTSKQFSVLLNRSGVTVDEIDALQETMWIASGVKR